MSLFRFCRPDDIPLIVRAINECYDVHFPEETPMTVEQFKFLIRTYGYWTSNCMIAQENRDPIGIIVGTKREYGCWIAMIGMKPGFERQGIGSHLVDSLMRKLSIIGPRKISVDVPEAHEGVKAFFTTLGFSLWDRYFTYEGSLEPSSKERNVEQVDPEKILEYYAHFHPLPQCWERDAESVRKQAPFVNGYAYREGSDLPGYLLLQEERVVDLAIDPNADHLRVGKALLAHASHLTGKPIRIPKVPEQDPLREMLEKLGFPPVASHLFMGKDLPKKER
ncbi:MAG: GNAT family N-acetyltransferase [Candidatus Tectomicrobia bacterium]|nr:GNAT family N-acetyltransferase [Candidatus Tectomicrobia bacterium]